MSDQQERKHYLDWLRVLAFLLLILFHCAMPFVVFGWEIKNPGTSVALSRLVWWLHQWRLPLLFLVSGVGIFFSLRRRSLAAFTWERVKRLLVPLLFAMFFTIPLQVYFERLQRGQYQGSYASFYPSVWEMVPYPDGSLTWSHMWYVVYLFVFSLLLLPLFALLRVRVIRSWKDRLATWLSSPLPLALLFLPFAWYYHSLYLEYPEQMNLVDDWFLFISSLTFLVYGYLLGGSEKFWATCERYRYSYLVIALCCAAYLLVNYWWALEMPKEQNTALYVYGILNSLHVWLLVLALAGFARHHLNFRNRFLDYMNAAVYPFYILHQTIIVAAGFYIVSWNLPIGLKLLILAGVSFGSLLLLYQYLVQPVPLMRFLFGMRTRKAGKKVPAIP